jgi:hypothetical protein
MALAIAGFSGITIAFIRTPGRLSDLERYRLAWLFGASFGAMFLGLLPIALRAVDISSGSAIRIASGALVAFTVTWYSLLIGPTRRFLRETPAIFQLPILYGLAVGHAASTALQTAVAAGAWQERAEGIFACGIVWLLFHAAYQFSRILFVRPAE